MDRGNIKIVSRLVEEWAITTRTRHAPISVFVATDESVTRHALVDLLLTCSDYIVSGEASISGADSAVSQLSPDVVLLHIGSPHTNILKLISWLKTRNVPVVTLLSNKNGLFVQACRRAGALGFVSVTSRSANLYRAIDAVAKRRPYLDAVFADQLLGMKVEMSEQRSDELSARESQVVKYVAYGYTSAEIAHRLGISTKTVETYRARSMRKLNLNGRPELVRFALLTGILSPLNAGEPL